MEGTEPFREPPDHAGRDVCCQHGSSPLGGRTAQRPGAGCDVNNLGAGPTPTMSSAVFETGPVIRCAVAS